MDKSQAEYLSANTFLNAYVRELDDWEREDVPSSWRLSGFPAQALTIPLDHHCLWIGVDYWSECGRHRFVMPARLMIEDSTNFEELDFLPLSKILVENAAAQKNASIGAMARALERIIESHKNIQHSLALKESNLDQLFRGHLNFRESEQGLITGHSVHPAPKVRQPMTSSEAEKFGPDGEKGFALAWLSVRKERIHYQSADEVSLDQRIQQIVAADDEWLEPGCDVSETHQLIPAHPWQLQKLKQHPQLKPLFNSGDIVELGINGSPWFATSSMRSLYAEALPYMLKFSMSVRLTNSVRHLQPVEAERGCLISQVLASEVGHSFDHRFQQFTIMQEPAYSCLVGEEGLPVLESMMVFRQNPIHAGIDNGYELLANLCQDHPDKNQCRASELINQVAQVKQLSLERACLQWFDGYMKTVLEPLILAQADYGILFGAHQQNIVLKLKDGIPHHCFFRDCQGTGFSAVGVKLFKLDEQQLGELAENQLNEEMANKLFAYYLIINSSFSLISALAADQIVDEQVLLIRLQKFLKDLLRGNRKDSSFLEYVLYSEKLWQKGNFFCSLADLNENTLADPLSIYIPINNPFYGLSLSNPAESRMQYE